MLLFVNFVLIQLGLLTFTQKFCFNRGNIVSCTLWDGFAQQLADFVNGHKDDYVIMIIQLGKVREWKGDFSKWSFPIPIFS